MDSEKMKSEVHSLKSEHKKPDFILQEIFHTLIYLLVQNVEGYIRKFWSKGDDQGTFSFIHEFSLQNEESDPKNGDFDPVSAKELKPTAL